MHLYYVTLIDPSIGTCNGGDYIIIKSINSIISELFPYSFVTRISNHKKLDRNDYKVNKESHYIFVGGTNLISSNMLKNYYLWKINIIDSLFLKKIILLGVGWWQYQSTPDYYTRILLKRILHRKLLHSIRDSYTQEMLRGIGIKNTIVTSCPTTWSLTRDHCRLIPSEKADNVVFTLTDYSKNPSADKIFISILKRNYKRIHFWIQGKTDLNYLTGLGENFGIHFIGPSVEEFERFLSLKIGTLDYIGTRLHAGIKAMQFQRRSIIIAIDNRATEIARDIHLPILYREKIGELEILLQGSFQTNIELPVENINIWKNQFLHLTSSDCR